MVSQLFKSSIQSQKRFLATAHKQLAVEGKYKSRSAPSNFKPKKIEPGVYYQPSPSIPSPLQKTPNAFLPKKDPRKVETTEYTAADISNMPPLNEVRDKKYNLTAEQMEEIKALRESDPYKYTKKVLADKYQCSEFFISLVADTPKERLDDMSDRLATIKSMWSKRRAQARVDRQKRKESWYQDA